MTNVLRDGPLMTALLSVPLEQRLAMVNMILLSTLGVVLLIVLAAVAWLYKSERRRPAFRSSYVPATRRVAL